eukprot:8993296-Pyramimonas_sp.AAC.1
MASTRRPSCDLTPAQYCDILNILPITATKHGSQFILYPSVNGKGAVKWECANPHRRAITMLLQQSGGVNVNQISFFKAAMKFNQDKHLGLSDDQVEKGVYRLRVIVSQMCNMVSKSRAVPRPWRK